MKHIALAAKALSEKLGCPVCEISAINKTGLPELKSAIKQLLLNPKSPSTKLIYQQDVGDALAAIRNSITDQSKTATFYSVKLLSGDETIMRHFSPELIKQAAGYRAQLESTYDDEMESIISEQRYSWIQSIQCC